jgi:spermidine synthase
LFSESFFKNLYKCLRPGGILTLQSESPHFNTKAFAELYQCLGGIFGAGKVHTYLGFIPTYPTGMWGFNYACKGDTHPIAELDEAAANAFSKAQGLKYYNAAMHKAAFSLPPFVEEILKG